MAGKRLLQSQEKAVSAAGVTPRAGRCTTHRSRRATGRPGRARRLLVSRASKGSSHPDPASRRACSEGVQIYEIVRAKAKRKEFTLLYQVARRRSGLPGKGSKVWRSVWTAVASAARAASISARGLRIAVTASRRIRLWSESKSNLRSVAADCRRQSATRRPLTSSRNWPRRRIRSPV